MICYDLFDFFYIFAHLTNKKLQKEKQIYRKDTINILILLINILIQQDTKVIQPLPPNKEECITYNKTYASINQTNKLNPYPWYLSIYYFQRKLNLWILSLSYLTTYIITKTCVQINYILSIPHPQFEGGSFFLLFHSFNSFKLTYLYLLSQICNPSFTNGCPYP